VEQFPFKEWVTSSNLVGLTIYCNINTKDQIAQKIVNTINNLKLELSFLLYSKYLTIRLFLLSKFIFFNIVIIKKDMKIEKIEKYIIQKTFFIFTY
ncbi:MAG: hypothetical protein EBT01_02700, partial [Proteobacteria bacterium]|nr:hypothetical protein [Candidatus Fonsibacter sp. PEL3]NBZ97822.1 hypothetical protein [Candidatus Fonsibacter sp. PEL4]